MNNNLIYTQRKELNQTLMIIRALKIIEKQDFTAKDYDLILQKS
jgi:hypothetical protein